MTILGNHYDNFGNNYDESGKIHKNTLPFPKFVIVRQSFVRLTTVQIVPNFPNMTILGKNYDIIGKKHL